MPAIRIILQCPKCQGKLRVPKPVSRIKVNCAHCGASFEVEPDEEMVDAAVEIVAAEPTVTKKSSDEGSATQTSASYVDSTDVWIKWVSLATFVVAAAIFSRRQEWASIVDFQTWQDATLSFGTLKFIGLSVLVTGALGFVVAILIGAISSRTENQLVGALLGAVIGVFAGSAISSAVAWGIHAQESGATVGVQASIEPKEAGTSPPQRQLKKSDARPIVAEKKLAAQTPSPQTNSASPSSVERDRIMLGLTDAWKDENSEKVLDYAQQLQKLGEKVPPTVHYFSAEANLKMKKYPAALAEARAYLELGNTSRYYEQALRVSLKADEGLNGARKQWNESLASLVRRLGGKLVASVKWREEVLMNRWPHHFECRMSLSGGTVKVVLEPETIVVRKTEDPPPYTRGNCVELSGAKGLARTGTLDVAHKAPSYLGIPFDQITKISISTEITSCSKRYESDLCAFSEYGSLRDPQGKEWWLLNGYFVDNAREELKILQKLYEDNGKSLF